MAEATKTPLHDNPDIKELLEILKSPGFQSQQQEYTSLLDSVETIVNQYDAILTELDDLKEKVSKIADKKNPLAIMVERLETLATGIGEKLKNLKDGIISFTKNALDSVKEKGLSALGSVFGFLRVKDGLQAISNSLAKSVDGLNKAVARINSLEKHSQTKAETQEISDVTPPSETQETRDAIPLSETQETNDATPLSDLEEQAPSLSELLADTRFDFENMSQNELRTVYEKLLTIGMDNDLTASENVCLQSLVDEVDKLLPHIEEANLTQENELDQGEEI
jgi:uncharacterized protein Yka (UPF0111/DUF47 family)